MLPRTSSSQASIAMNSMRLGIIFQNIITKYCRIKSHCIICQHVNTQQQFSCTICLSRSVASFNTSTGSNTQSTPNNTIPLNKYTVLTMTTFIMMNEKTHKHFNNQRTSNLPSTNPGNIINSSSAILSIYERPPSKVVEQTDVDRPSPLHYLPPLPAPSFDPKHIYFSSDTKGTNWSLRDERATLSVPPSEGLKDKWLYWRKNYSSASLSDGPLRTQAGLWA